MPERDDEQTPDDTNEDRGGARRNPTFGGGMDMTSWSTRIALVLLAVIVVVMIVRELL
jgi:hypothetical protein